MIGVCIKYFHPNYGGMLQAYATVKLLEAHGLAYELIRYRKRPSLRSMATSAPRLLNRVLLNDKYEAAVKMAWKIRRRAFAASDAARAQAFERFQRERFTALSPVFAGYAALCRGAARYRAVMTGSDQLWSPAGLPTHYYDLMFAPEGVRRISYASSFGVKDIPWYQRRRTAAYLRQMDCISMRETRGAEIVKALTGRDVPTVLDPVLMFCKEQWETLIPPQKEEREPYLLAYFLGANPAHRQAVRQLAAQLRCKVVALRHLDRFVPADETFGDECPYDVDPARFLNILRGAAYVCTDSFHGACFSILHRKRFMVFDRYATNAAHSKNARIDTLCESLSLTSRRFNGANLDVLAQPIDYLAVERRLRALREMSDAYLCAALQGL